MTTPVLSAHDAHAGLVLPPLDLGDRVAADHGRVGPFWLGERGGDDVLGHAARAFGSPIDFEQELSGQRSITRQARLIESHASVTAALRAEDVDQEL